MDDITEKLLHIRNDLVDYFKAEPSLEVFNELHFDEVHVPNYQNLLYQRLYLLRYLYAFHFEYYRLFDDLLNLIDGDVFVKTRILSIGCGSGFDYSAIRKACNENPTVDDNDCDQLLIDYIGLDKADWIYPFPPQKEDKVRIYTGDAVEWIEKNPFDFAVRDILLFPKVIHEFSPETFEGLLRAITKKDCQCTRKRVAILGSFRKSEKHHKQDTERFDRFVNCYKDFNHYTVENQLSKNFFEKGNYSKISDYQHFKGYPDLVKQTLNMFYKNCNKYRNQNDTHCDPRVCKDAVISINPVINDSHVNYKIVVLTKSAD